MAKHIASIAFIYVCVCISWCVLGNVVLGRSYSQADSLSQSVRDLWGAPQTQIPPSFSFDAGDEKSGGVSCVPDASTVNVALNLEQRKKGLLWYPTYRVKFAGDYEVTNTSDEARRLRCVLKLPAQHCVYDNLNVSIGKTQLTETIPKAGQLVASAVLEPHHRQIVHLAYDSQGLDEWRYGAPSAVAQVRNFKMTMKTDFDEIDFPTGTRSPTSKQRDGKGWNLVWSYANTIASDPIGVSMPRLLNPGPWVSEVTFFAPVSLFFFFFVVWLTTTIKSIRIHPMHYFFIGASFFSFHLLLAYSVDHIPVEFAFVIASCVSVFLVLSYIRRAIPIQHFCFQIGLAQFVYLVFFSFTFFLQQFTGLIITALSILTLFICMQSTARFDWSVGFRKNVIAEDPLALIEQEYGT